MAALGPQPADIAWKPHTVPLAEVAKARLPATATLDTVTPGDAGPTHKGRHVPPCAQTAAKA
jgi:hypothetical protein